MTVPAAESIARLRLMALGDHVEENAQREEWLKFFNMGKWVGEVMVKDHPSLQTGDEVEVNNDCGTSACLLGHGVNVPMLREAGLRTYVLYSGCRYVRSTLAVVTAGEKTIIGDISATATYPVAKKLFGITEIRFLELFMYGSHRDKPMNTISPMEAVKNLRKVVDQIDQNEGWSF